MHYFSQGGLIRGGYCSWVLDTTGGGGWGKQGVLWEISKLEKSEFGSHRCHIKLREDES